MLDRQGKNYYMGLSTVLQCVLDFRSICKNYFLRRVDEDDDEFSDEDDEFEYADSLDRKVESKQRIAEREGLGLLKVASSDFMTHAQLCNQELNTLKIRFEQTMGILMQQL